MLSKLNCQQQQQQQQQQHQRNIQKSLNIQV